jgi:hypothetical protein
MSVDLNKLGSPAALKAALHGGTAGWGELASAERNVRYCDPIADRRRARKCGCGCGKRAAHTGKANGIALMSGCELYVRRWVRNPSDTYRPR